VSEISRVSLFGKLNSLAYKTLEGATVFCKLRGNSHVELAHWIQQILQAPDSDVHRIIRHFDLDTSRLAKDVMETLDRLPGGATSISDLSSELESAVERAWVYATLMFNLNAIRTGIVLIGILKTPSLRKALIRISIQFERVQVDSLTEEFLAITKGSPEDELNSQDGTELIKPFRDIFISYRRQDSVHATGRIFDRLVAEFGRERVFKDVNSIPAGIKNFAQEIENQVRSARVMLAVVGAQWLKAQDGATGRRRIDDKDDFVRIELKCGLETEGVAVLPVLIDDASMPGRKDLPSQLKQFASCQAVTVRADPEFERDVRSLIAHIWTWVGSESRPKPHS
jgi:hypothetical protein